MVTSEILRKAQVLMAQGLKVREAAARLKVAKPLSTRLWPDMKPPSIARLDARPRSVKRDGVITRIRAEVLRLTCDERQFKVVE